ncbi:signal peptidase I [Buchnera aphidicola]|nr:signal peptidase I [Buchnera aphidicola]
MLTSIIIVLYSFNYKKNFNYINFQKKKKKKKKIIELIKNFLILILILIVRLFFFESYIISSGSMKPTLFTGDCVIVQKFFINTNNHNYHIWKNFYKPKRNDVIVFKNIHDNNINYVKRIVGVPGDIIFYHPFEKKIYIIKNKNFFLKKKDKFLSSNFIKNHKYKKLNFINTYHTLRLICCTEKHNGYSHDIIIIKGIKNCLFSINRGNKYIQKWVWIIPKDQYFVMGDNRDKSFDSRFWGVISKRNILGKVKFIWFSCNYTSKIWLKIVRFNRIFKKIQ